MLSAASPSAPPSLGAGGYFLIAGCSKDAGAGGFVPSPQLGPLQLGLGGASPQTPVAPTAVGCWSPVGRQSASRHLRRGACRGPVAERGGLRVRFARALLDCFPLFLAASRTTCSLAHWTSA